ncbi:MAG: beta-N-acetylhexosaminidase [Deltaproteobacteria bacterium]|nr:beta-N-acetylhexosaminidase [Deltaproteobacteria bacterium]
MKDLKNLVGSHFMFGLGGTSLSQTTISFIKEVRPAGFIIMGENYESPEQIHDLCVDLQTISKEPLLIGVDQEGGRVARLKEPFIKIPKASLIGEKNSPKWTFDLYHALGKELRSVGINLDFAPVCDILTNPKNKVIGDRSFSSDLKIVESLTSASVRGLQKAGVIACAKHYPGHGDTLEDSHESLPHVKTQLKTLESRELAAFKKAIKSGVETIMTAHLMCDALDKDMPTTLSVKALQKLRKDLRFSGLIISDDMNMGAISEVQMEEDALYLAVEAGIDLLLYCDPLHDHHKKVFEYLYKKTEKDSSFLKKLQESYKRLQKIKDEYLVDPLPPKDAWKNIVGSQEHSVISFCHHEEPEKATW